MTSNIATITLWRPVGPAELRLIAEAAYREFPPRLPEKPIFHPVLNEAYAVAVTGAPDTSNEVALRRNMHKPIPEQGAWLRQVVTGYFAYHAVPTNSRSIAAFHHHVTDLWWRTLKRRGQKDRTTWADMTKLVNQWLPRPRILHPWPSTRFAVKHPRWEPYAGKPHVRFCAGGA